MTETTQAQRQSQNPQETDVASQKDDQHNISVNREQQQQLQQHRQQQQKGDDGDDEWLFSCRCESARAVSTLLSCLRHVSVASSVSAPDTSLSTRPTELTQRKGRNTIQPVHVFCSPSNLTFHVYGTARQSQASVNLQAGLFSEYHVTKRDDNNSNSNSKNNNNAMEEESSSNDNQTNTNGNDDDWKYGGEFCVNLSTVLECLHVFGTQNLERTKLCVSYNLSEEIFKLELLEDGVLSTAAIPGMLPPEDNGNSLALAFRSGPIVARMIIKSESLREALQELELVSGATCCTVALGPDGLELAAVGNIGECLVSLPGANDSIVSLESSAVHARSYPLSSFLSGMRGLEFAEETCMSINEAGMIAIQHQVLDTVGQGSPSFVDFIMSCLQDDEEESSNRVISQESLGWGLSQTSSHAAKLSTSSKRSSPSTHDNGADADADADEEDNDTTDNGHDGDNDDDDYESSLPPVKAAPLFGTVVDETANSRYKRRRRRPPTRSAPQTEYVQNDDDDDEPLDVTETVSPVRKTYKDQEDGCSSPEVVYG